MDQAKPFSISKREVWESYKLVRANRGAAGIDGQSISAFEKNLANNLFKIWNRMSSGSYFPLAVRRVEIPKDTGGKRPLGIPTVSDRIAQMVVKRYLEPIVEACFHPDSYGYRPGKSALAAAAAARTRCWRNDWVLDLDIKGFFDNIDHDLLMRAVRHHTDCPWVYCMSSDGSRCPCNLRMAQSSPGTRGRPKVELSVHCWQTFSCIMCSMYGWTGIMQTSHSNATLMMRFVTVGVRTGPGSSRTPWSGVLLTVNWSYTLRRRRSSTAGTMTAEARTQIILLIFWVMASGPGPRGITGESSSSTSVQQSATRLRSESGKLSGVCVFTSAAT